MKNVERGKRHYKSYTPVVEETHQINFWRPSRHPLARLDHDVQLASGAVFYADAKVTAES